MKRLSYLTAVKAIAMSVAFALSTPTFAAETKSAKTAKEHSSKAAPTSVAKKAPSWLFVLQAKKGTMSKTDKKGVYTLLIKHSDMGPAIAFTDRPDRIVKKITPEQLKSIWNKGVDSFEKDPPNAVFTAQGHQAVIVEITGFKVLPEAHAHRLTFIVTGHHPLLAAGAEVTDIVLSIDDDRWCEPRCCTFAIVPSCD